MKSKVNIDVCSYKFDFFDNKVFNFNNLFQNTK